MRRITTYSSCVITLLIISFASLSYSQERGYDLYKIMGNGITKEDGVRGLTWLPDNMGYLEVETKRSGEKVFFRVNPGNQKKAPLFDDKTIESLVEQYNEITNEDEKGLPFQNFNFVMDNKAIFFTEGNIPFVFELESKKLRKLTRPKVARQPGTDEGLMRGMARSQLWNGSYSDDYTKFGYVKDYDLYIVDTSTGQEKRLTYGSEEKMNGRPSWVYPEEFRQRDAYWFSPDAGKLAYLQYNEKDVHQYPIVHELDFEAGLELERYPKAGETNPTVKLFIADIASGKNIEIDTNSGPNTYIVKPTWLRNGRELTFQRLNRNQNYLELIAVNPETATMRTILTETDPAYVKLHNDFIQLKDNKHFLWSSERSGYKHLYLYNVDGTLVRQLTEGEWPVGSIVRVDEDKKTVFFTGYGNMGMDSYFYSVKFDGSKFKKLTREPGWHTVNMDPAGKYYIDRFSSLDTPPESNLYSADGKLIRNLSRTNIDRVNELGLQKPELLNFKAADGTTDLVGLLFKPADFDPNKQYPILLPLYGGPESQDARNTYASSGNYQRLAQLGFLVLRMNYRGSGNRGKAFATLHYMNLGTLEMDDYAAGVKHIAQRPYADGSRVGVYGHSYGGYSTVMLMLRYPDVFHVGVAGSSVTDWRSYDTIYTERYMRTPQTNKKGYDNGSAMQYVNNLKGKLMLTTGSIDNNVHPGNTVHLIDALIRADKDFDLMYFPGQRHGYRGAHGRYYSRIRLDYFVKHLKPEAKEDYFAERGK